MSFLLGVLGSSFWLFLFLIPVFFIYVNVKDAIRMVLHKKGYRVFTIQEMKLRGLIPDVQDGVIEAEVIQKAQDNGDIIDAEVISVNDPLLETIKALDQVSARIQNFDTRVYKKRRTRR